MLKPYTERQRVMIVNNVIKALEDPKKLSKQAYGFLYLCSGFIAHYNHKGFIGFYSREGSLKNDILKNVQFNQWKNFTPKDSDYAYYMSTADIYNRIVNTIKQGV